jgi:hypothetical protein
LRERGHFWIPISTQRMADELAELRRKFQMIEQSKSTAARMKEAKELIDKRKQVLSSAKLKPEQEIQFMRSYVHFHSVHLLSNVVLFLL